MSVYIFDETVDRRGTSCLKYDFAAERGYPEDVLPLWVADMDFRTAPVITNALHKAVDHGIFGYTRAKEDYCAVSSKWFSENFGWTPDTKWLSVTPGVVFALSAAVRAFTNEGDSILIQPPVYYPFYSVIKDNNRKISENELLCINGRYEMDLVDFERKIEKDDVKMFILCSPHNPVGRVWSAEELSGIGEICLRHNVLVVSDEIHCDFVFGNNKHHIFAKAVPQMLERCVVCTSPSKSFNLAGLQISNIWIADPLLRRRFRSELNRVGYTEHNTLGLAAAKAAYSGGREWLSSCLEYIRGNYEYLCDFIDSDIPGIKPVRMEGTYFAWLDCSGLGLDKEQLDDLVINKAGLWLDPGYIFGKNSGQYQRIVLACPRSTLENALERLKKAVKSLYEYNDK